MRGNQPDQDSQRRSRKQFTEDIDDRALQGNAAEKLVNHRQVDHRSGNGGFEIGRMGILQPGGGTSDDDEGAVGYIEADLVQNVGRGNDDEPVDGPLMEQEAALLSERVIVTLSSTRGG